MSLTDKDGRVNPIRLISDEPVFEQEDLGLGMETWAKIVAGVATGTDGPFTVGVFARWGRGKTSVLNRACHFASFADHTHAFVVNAWEHERHTDPLQPIIQDVLRGIDIRLTQAENQEQLRALNGLKKLLTILTVTTAALTLGVPTVALASPAIAEGMGAIADAVKKGAEGGREMAGAIEALSGMTETGATQGTGIRAMLSNARATYAPKEKVIVFVDDLDRCHPDKAVHILESIKHLLWVPGFVFVLALDNEILEKYLQNRYEEKFGIKDDPKIGQRYLEKLVQLTLYLPESQTNFEEYVQKLITPEGEPERLPVDLIGLLVASAEANPRQAKRRINDLIVDVAIFKAEQEAKNTEFEASDAEIAACLAVNRLFYDLFNLNRGLVKRVASSQALCNVVLETLDKGFGNVDVSDGDQQDSDGSTQEELRDDAMAMLRLAHERSSLTYQFNAGSSHGSDAVQQQDPRLMARVIQEKELSSLFQENEPARSWFRQETLRKATREFLVHQRGEELDAPIPQREIVEDAIRESLDLPPDHPITEAERNRVVYLDLSGAALEDIDLYAVARLHNLEYLYLESTSIANVSPLAALSNLKYLNLGETQVSEIAPLSGASSLTKLILRGTQVSDVTPLSTLTNLTYLTLRHTQVSDVTPLATLTNLTYLNLGDTQVSDVSPLLTLVNLTHLNLMLAPVSDISPLANLTSLMHLSLTGSQITEVTPLATLTNLHSLILGATQVSDVSPLANLTNLRILNVAYTNVSNVSALSHLKNLEIEGYDQSGG